MLSGVGGCITTSVLETCTVHVFPANKTSVSSMCVVRMGGVVFPCRSYVYLQQVYDLEVVNGGGSGLKDIHKAHL